MTPTGAARKRPERACTAGLPKPVGMHAGNREAMTGANMSTHHGILLHVVFSTKYRFKSISQEWSDDLYAYIGGTVREHDAVLLTSGGTEDHVHLLI